MSEMDEQHRKRLNDALARKISELLGVEIESAEIFISEMTPQMLRDGIDLAGLYDQHQQHHQHRDEPWRMGGGLAINIDNLIKMDEESREMTITEATAVGRTCEMMRDAIDERRSIAIEDIVSEFGEGNLEVVSENLNTISQNLSALTSNMFGDADVLHRSLAMHRFTFDPLSVGAVGGALTLMVWMVQDEQMRGVVEEFMREKVGVAEREVQTLGATVGVLKRWSQVFHHTAARLKASGLLEGEFS